jgi:hypothetical protein
MKTSQSLYLVPFRARLFPLIALGLGFVTACQDHKTERPTVTEKPVQSSPAPAGTQIAGQDAALVRVINGDPTNVPAGYKFNDQLIVGDVPYKSVTEFVPVLEATARLTLFNDITPGELAASTQTFVKGNRYTVLRMTNSAGKIELNIMNDKMTQPAPGSAKVRFAVASPWLGEFTIASGDKRAFKSLEPHATMDYTDVAPYSGKLELYGKANRKPLGFIDAVTFEAGKLYTVIVLGGRDAMPIDKIVVVDKFI